MAGFSMWQGPMPHSHETPGGGERVKDAWLDGCVGWKQGARVWMPLLIIERADLSPF